MYGDNARVNTLDRGIGQVPVSYQSSLVTPIMLDVKDKVNANLLVAIWSRNVFPKVLEYFI